MWMAGLPRRGARMALDPLTGRYLCTLLSCLNLFGQMIPNGHISDSSTTEVLALFIVLSVNVNGP